MQTAQCICRSRYRFGWVWVGMANTEPQQARTSCQPRLLRIRPNLNPSSAKCLLRAGLSHNYTHAYIKATIRVLQGKLPARKSNDTILSFCSKSVRQSVSGTSRVQVLGTPSQGLREDGASATAAAAPAQGFVETFRAPVAGAAATKLPAGGVHLCQIRDLTSESTRQPAITCRPPFQLVSQSTSTDRRTRTICVTPLGYADNLDYLPHSRPRLFIFSYTSYVCSTHLLLLVTAVHLG